MARRQHLPIYFADDRDINDILFSFTRTYSTGVLLSFLRNHRIYVSPKTERAKLIALISDQFLGWPSIHQLLEMIQTPDKKEKVTSDLISLPDSSLDKLIGVFESVRDERDAIQQEVYTIKKNGEKTAAIEISYSEVDYAKTRLLQRRLRTLSVQLELEDGQLKVRREANDRSDSIFADFITKLEVPDSAHKPISLAPITDAEQRTKFFIGLMNNMDGFEFFDLVYVAVDCMTTDDDDEQEEDDESENPSDEGDSDSIPQMTAEAKKLVLAASVNSASFKGTGLLQTPEYRQLKDKGFFISAAIWKSTELKPNGRQVEFQAEFTRPRIGTGFKYQIRGLYDRKKSGFKTTRVPATGFTNDFYLQVLENTAVEALEYAVSPSAPNEGSPK